MTTALEFFLNSSRSVVELETLQISHPNFTRTYWVVRNHREGITAFLENATEQAFEYYPLQITNDGDESDLDTGIKINFGDLGQVLPLELDAITIADGMAIKPVVIYRTYRSDDLSAPLIGPTTFQVTSFSFTRAGASFDATAPYVNRTKTGESYNLTRFPMLRGFLK